MIELVGDLWEEHAAGAVVAITTNGSVSKQGTVSMLRGCARQARERYPHLPRRLGELIAQNGSHVFELGNRIVSFPVEHGPFEVPELGLIEQSCRELVELTDDRQWPLVVVPRPGCGGGGLIWDEVKTILERHFDGRFRVISSEER